MTKDEIEAIADRAAEKAVRLALPDLLRSLGIDASNPLDAQADMAYLRAWRLAVEKVRTQGMLAAVGVIITGIAGSIWYVVKH